VSRRRRLAATLALERLDELFERKILAGEDREVAARARRTTSGTGIA
jgi:hypothetical protein